ncbi:unnamed protein product [Prorocentrum cordatum]|uniref:Uncharacterized protein n=1 Tax=Prorocentrum cordatum TaxID=2364126 RepID=A0ABN9S8R1_9DINO|nr:unnamed protein product [Polarella glacialis]
MLGGEATELTPLRGEADLAVWRQGLRDLACRCASAGGTPGFQVLLVDGGACGGPALADVAGLVSCGEVLGLWPPDERRYLVEQLQAVTGASGARPPGSARGSSASRLVSGLKSMGALPRGAGEEKSWARIHHRLGHWCRERLRVVVCLPASADVLRERLRRFPALLRCCTTDWFDPWPASALESVAKRLLADGLGEQACACARMCQRLQSASSLLADRLASEQGRWRYHVPFASFLDLIRNFDGLLEVRRAEGERLRVCREGAARLLGTLEVPDSKEQPALDGPLLERVALLRELLQDHPPRDGQPHHDVGDSLLAAALSTHLSAFPPAVRRDTLQAWAAELQGQGLAPRPGFSLADFLTRPAEVRRWVAASPPGACAGAESAAAVMLARRAPLCIDPQGQAGRWLRAMEQPSGLLVLAAGQRGWLLALARAEEAGRTVLLEGLGEVMPPELEQVLDRRRAAGVAQVAARAAAGIAEARAAGGESADAGEGGEDPFGLELALDDEPFREEVVSRLYLTTWLSDPAFSPQTCVRAALVDFSVCPEALQDRLLACLLSDLEPTCAEPRADLAAAAGERRVVLADVEEMLLQLSLLSPGDVLSDEPMAELARRGRTAGERHRAATRAMAEAGLAAAEAAFVGLAEYAAAMLLSLAALERLDPMYAQSVTSLEGLFGCCCMEVAGASAGGAAAGRGAGRLAEAAGVREAFTNALLAEVGRSLLPRHRALLPVVLALGVGRLEPAGSPFSASAEDCQALPTLARPEQWHGALVAAGDPDALLQEGSERLSVLQRVLALRRVGPEAASEALVAWAEEALGVAGRPAPRPQLKELLAHAAEDSGPELPVVLLLSPGLDPLPALLCSAGASSRRLRAVTLGPGRWPLAAAAVAEASAAGAWALLENCHLAPESAGDLAGLCEELHSGDPRHADFRLWISCLPGACFPRSVLLESLRLACGPPQGVKAQLKAALEAMPHTDGVKLPRSVDEATRTLALVHGAAAARLDFGALGWSTPYAVKHQDLVSAAHELQCLAQQSPNEDPARALGLALLDCGYGGAGPQDQAMLMALIDVFQPGAAGGALTRARRPQAVLALLESVPEPSLPAVCGFSCGAQAHLERRVAEELLCDLAVAFPAAHGALAAAGGGQGGEAGVPDPWECLALTLVPLLASLPALAEAPSSWREGAAEGGHLELALEREVQRYGALLGAVEGSLQRSSACREGREVPGADDEALLLSVAQGRVPAAWLALSYLSPKPLRSYIEDLADRVLFINEWAARGAPPAEFWLPGLFAVRPFLAAARCELAERLGVPADGVEVDFSDPSDADPGAVAASVATAAAASIVESAATAAAAAPGEAPAALAGHAAGGDEGDGAAWGARGLGVWAHGLFLQGCRWDPAARHLAELEPGVGALPVPLPPVQIGARLLGPDGPEGAPARLAPDSGRYRCPVYCTPLRGHTMPQQTVAGTTDPIFRIGLRSALDQKHWVRCGAAALTQLDS